MNSIKIEGIKCFAFHGCHPKEALTGGYFETNIEIFADLSKSFLSDDINNTVDYVVVCKIVLNEMKIKSKLIETVGYRIAKKIKQNFKIIEKISVEIIKKRAPTELDAKNVKICISL